MRLHDFCKCLCLLFNEVTTVQCHIDGPLTQKGNCTQYFFHNLLRLILKKKLFSLKNCDNGSALPKSLVT